jgi:hypothetical protein
MHRIFSLVRACLLFFSSATLLGCGGASDGRVAVSGRVAFQGQDVAVGQIRFVPGKETRGPLTVARIENGKYHTDDTGGVPIGTHRVEILAYDAEEYATAPRGPGVPPIRQLLPEKYNRQSELVLVLESSPTTIEKDFVLD